MFNVKLGSVMKKVICFVSAVCLLFFSCSKDVESALSVLGKSVEINSDIQENEEGAVDGNHAEEEGAYFNATVLGKNYDCGDGAFLIQFDVEANALIKNTLGDGITDLPASPAWNVYTAINLPEEYQKDGENIRVKFRAPADGELMVCKTFGPAYPQIYIVNVK
jgi:hypothetical protein